MLLFFIIMLEEREHNLYDVPEQFWVLVDHPGLARAKEPKK